MITTTEKIKVARITIKRAEGPSRLCGILKVFQNWEDANRWMFSQASTFPATGGYDKHDFVVTFADGETYSGRLDCKAITCNDPDLDVRKHVKDFVLYLSGLQKPDWQTWEQYDKALTGENRQEAINYLKKYDI